MVSEQRHVLSDSRAYTDVSCLVPECKVSLKIVALGSKAMHVCVHICARVFVCLYVHACMHACVCVCICAGMYIIYLCGVHAGHFLHVVLAVGVQIL